MFEFVIAATDDQSLKIEEGMIVCQALVELNKLWFDKHPEDLCALGSGAVMYDKESEAQLDDHQVLRTAPILIREGRGLCMEIVAFEVAARQVMGQQAKPYIFKKAPGIYHVQMKLKRGDKWKTVDVSVELEKKGYVRTPGCRIE